MIADRIAIRSLKLLVTLSTALVAIALAAQPAAAQNHLWSQQFGGINTSRLVPRFMFKGLLVCAHALQYPVYPICCELARGLYIGTSHRQL